MGTSSQHLLVLKEIIGNPPVHLDPLQQFLAPHIQLINGFWISLWCITILVLAWRLVREYLDHKKK